MEDEESLEHDSVVSEVDVYIRNVPDNGELFLLQYPLRPSNLDYTGPVHLGARYKPNCQMMELDVMVDINGKNYSRQKGEQMALNVDGTDQACDGGKYYESNVADKEVLVSSRVTEENLERPENYCIGVFTRKGLVLMPLRNIFHMKPTFKHLDIAEEKQLDEGGVGNDAEEDDQNKLERVTVKFATNEQRSDERQSANKQESFETVQRQMDEEPWQHMAYLCEEECTEFVQFLHEYPNDDNDVEDDMNGQETEEGITTDLLQQCAQSLLPCTNSMIASDDNGLNDVVMNMVKRCHILSFLKYHKYIRHNADELAKVLQQYAVHLCGDLWAARSDIIFNEDYSYSDHGTPRKTMIACRDLILYCLKRFDAVDVLKLKHATYLHMDDIQVCLGRTTKTSDRIPRLAVYAQATSLTDFRARFPSICDRQEMIWNQRIKILQEHFQLVDMSRLRPEPRDLSRLKEAPGDHAFTSMKNSSDQLNRFVDADHKICSIIHRHFGTQFWFNLTELRLRVGVELMHSGHADNENAKMTLSDANLIQCAAKCSFLQVNNRWPLEYRHQPVMMSFQLKDCSIMDKIREAMFKCLTESYCFMIKHIRDAMSDIVKSQPDIGSRAPTDQQIKAFVKANCESISKEGRIWYYLRGSLML